MRAHPLEEKRLVTDGKSLELAPGMAVVVEIKTGKRRDLDYCSRHSIRAPMMCCASSDLPPAARAVIYLQKPIHPKTLGLGTRFRSRQFSGTSLAGRESPDWVTGGKTPTEYIFSALPQVADIARCAFYRLVSPFVLPITAFWVGAIPVSALTQ